MQLRVPSFLQKMQTHHVLFTFISPTLGCCCKLEHVTFFEQVGPKPGDLASNVVLLPVWGISSATNGSWLCLGTQKRLRATR